MNVEAIEELFENLNVWKRGSERAPHKPLLLLLALAQIQSGAPRLIRFSEIDNRLTELLNRFGPPRASVHPEYPFWRLQHDKIWEIQSDVPLKSRSSNTDPPRSEFVEHDVYGGFRQEVYDQLAGDPSLIVKMAKLLLSEHFSPPSHAAIISAVNLSLK